jgi:hypothetical protein
LPPGKGSASALAPGRTLDPGGLGTPGPRGRTFLARRAQPRPPAPAVGPQHRWPVARARPHRPALRGALLVGAQSGETGRAGRNCECGSAGTSCFPGFASTLGYAPMRALGMGENLPAGVARQWARWGRHPEHLFSESAAKANASATCGSAFPSVATVSPMTTSPPGWRWSSSSASTEAQRQRSSPTPRRSLARRQSDTSDGLKPPFRDTLWREMADWLHSRADAVSSRRGEAHLPTRLLEPPARLDVEAGAKRGVQRPPEDSSPHPR